MPYASDAPGAKGMKKEGGYSENGYEGGIMHYPSEYGVNNSDGNYQHMDKHGKSGNRGRKAVKYSSSRYQQLTYTGKPQAPYGSMEAEGGM